MIISPYFGQGSRDLRHIKVLRHPNIPQPDLPVHCKVYRFVMTQTVTQVIPSSLLLITADEHVTVVTVICISEAPCSFLILSTSYADVFHSFPWSFTRFHVGVTNLYTESTNMCCIPASFQSLLFLQWIILNTMNRKRLVSRMTGYTLIDQSLFLDRGMIFFSSSCPDQPWGFISCPLATRDFSLE
jgi:hypothetical protein